MRTTIALCVVSLVVLSACPAPFTPSTTPAVTDVGTPTGSGAVMTSIGASGGSVKSADNKLEIVIPSGALSANTNITITPISATGPGARLAWRLGPEGTTFSSPVTIKFTASASDLAGTELAALRIATQNSKKQWESPETTISGNTVSVTTTHFSDWSMLTGWQITPGTSSVAPGGTQLLTVQFCNRDTSAEVVPLIATCQENSEIASLLGAWSVNGIERGNSDVGTVTSVDSAASYKAPSVVPSSNPVAVSVDFYTPSRSKLTLVASVNVVGPNYRGPASWTLVTSNSTTSANVGDLLWAQDRDEGTSVRYKPTGNITYTYTHTASPICDPVSSSVAIAEGELTVYQATSPVFPSAYVANFRATPTVTTMCQASGGQMMSTTFEVPLIFQVGFCTGSTPQPWTDVSMLSGNTGCGGFTTTASWGWSLHQ
ncbi:MAG: hypothetical protein QM817_00375 [Archangium sp.]